MGKEFILKDQNGKEQTFDDETIYVRSAAGELLPFTFGAGNSVLESLNVTENGTYTPSEGVDGFSSVTVNVGRVTLLEEQEMTGFAYDSTFGYAKMLEPSPFELVVGSQYTVVWDGVEYICTAYDGSVVYDGAVYIGNGSAFNQPSKGEPFAILYVGGICVCSGISDSAESHTIGIYKMASTGVDKKVVHASGSYSPGTDGEMAVAHTLGVVPDIIFIRSPGLIADKTFTIIVGLSDNLLSVDGAPMQIATVRDTNDVTYTSGKSITTESSLYGFIYGANEKSFKVGGAILPHHVGDNYTWDAYAISYE